MNGVFLKLLNMSVAGSVLILAVVALRALLKKAPRWIICAMWALVAIRLVCPVSIASPLSAFRASPSLVSESGEVEVFRPAGGNEKPMLAVDTVQIEVPRTSAETIQKIPGTSLAVTQRSRDTYLPPLVQAYLLGLTVMLLYALISTLLLRRKVSVSLRQRGNIRVCDDVASPFILGILRPTVYLPSSLSEEEKRFVLAHERAHLRRLDHIWKPLGFLILSVHWFNPFCWLAYVLLCRDIELACDEKVIRALGREERAAYSQTLLNCSAHRILAACPVAFGETDVKTRVKAVLNYKKPAFWIILAAVLGCIVLIVCFATKPPQEQDLSFLNYKNAIPLIGQNDTAPSAIWYREETGSIQPGVADSKALARYLEDARWTQRRAPGQALDSQGSIEFVIDDEYLLTVYKSPRLAVILNRDEKRYYRIGAGDYEAALETFIPAPSTQPDPPLEQTADTELVPSDPLAFLLSFSDAEIISLIDNTGRSYEEPSRSFDEIVSDEDWTAHATPGFPASSRPSRRIELISKGYLLGFEESDSSPEMLCYSYNFLLSSQLTVIYFDCGENLMDELIPWALIRAGEPEVADGDGFAPIALSFEGYDINPLTEYQANDPNLIRRVWDAVNPAAAEPVMEGSTWQIALCLTFQGENQALRLHLYPDDLMLSYYTGENYRLPEGTYLRVLEMLRPSNEADTENPMVTVTSGDVTIEPYPIMRFSETWTENGQLAADGMPVEGQLEQHAAEIPVLRMDGDLSVRIPQDTSYLALFVLDPKTSEPLVNEVLCNMRVEPAYEETISTLNPLAPGRYLCYFAFVRANSVTEPEERYDRYGSDCYFWLEIPER